MMKTELLQAEFNRGGKLQNLLLRYTHELFAQVTLMNYLPRLHKHLAATVTPSVN
ncbi:MAG: hypothetical protein V7K15_10240 [Nostoc sp.]